MKKIALLLILISFNIFAQKDSKVYLSAQYVGFTFHPGGGNTPEINPLKLDKKAYFVIQVGATLNLDYYFAKNILSEHLLLIILIVHLFLPDIFIWECEVLS